MSYVPHASTPASRFLLAFLPWILSTGDDGSDTEVEETLSSQVTFAYGVYGLWCFFITQNKVDRRQCKENTLSPSEGRK